MATDLHVPFLQQVQQPHLDPLCQVRQLVDGKDTPVDPRYQAVVQGELVGQIAAFGYLDGIHFADQVGDGDVRRCQLFGVAVVPMQPADGRLVAVLLR